MKVKLISYTKPAEEFLAEVGTEANVQDLVAYCARVSNPSNQMNTETSERLLKYLIKHKHWSPFEMVTACLEIETTRDIAHQIVRHRSFAFQEFSQRYADVSTFDDMFVIRETRMQDPKNRQNSIPFYESDKAGSDIADAWEDWQRKIQEYTGRAYTWALENGIAKEQARVVLPEGMTTTRLYMTGSLRSWIHYVELRSAHGTQKEHMDIAIECGKVITNIFPAIIGIIKDEG